jgi:hypothetical protein
MERNMKNTNNNHSAILDSTYFLSEERMNSLINTMWEADLAETRAHEGCVCSTLTRDGDCECEQKCADPSDWYPIHGNEYHGMLHDIAIKAFWKSTTESSPRADEVFNLGVQFLDKVEAQYNPNNKYPLPYNTYQACKSFRARLNLFRYKLYVLNYEQWAYLTNWLNVLTSWVHLKGEHQGEVIQYTCQEQGVVGNTDKDKQTDSVED